MSVHEPIRYLNRTQFAERLGVVPGALSRYKLPEPDVIVGPIDEAGGVSRGGVRGWTVETVEHYIANRPGRGSRTDLRSRFVARSADEQCHR
ncbi:hypothetical protein [Skermania piniformis]|uniref:Transcriptional regulator n=1 Tax=Skermania pinensis TaxID=39122 RepID=A0ABX8SCV1_9ACTN|nr:hypothetical protein [Skermania piniformis]QXQ15126.1 hypothetical protein KV203_07215 [Skermania piniformis]